MLAGTALQELPARRSASRSCSTAPSPAASTSSTGTIHYIGAFTQESTGGNVVAGFRLAELHARVHELQLRAGRDQRPEPGLHRSRRSATRNPFLPDALLLGTERRSGPSARSRRASCTTRSTTRSSRPPGALHAPARPRRPRRQHQLLQAAARSHPVLPADARSCRPASAPSSSTSRPWQDTALRADLRAAGPGRRVQRPRLRHPHHRPARPRSPALVIGGNKSLLFNGEYVYQIAGPVRVAGVLRRRPGPRRPARGSACDAFVASTGGEVRFFMPVLNVPFRLIFARNINYERHPGQQLPAGEEVALPLRRRLDFLEPWHGCSVRERAASAKLKR